MSCDINAEPIQAWVPIFASQECVPRENESAVEFFTADVKDLPTFRATTPVQQDVFPTRALPQDETVQDHQQSSDAAVHADNKPAIIPRSFGLLSVLAAIREKLKAFTSQPTNVSSNRHSPVDRLIYKLNTYISSKTGQIFVLCALGVIVVACGGCFLKFAEPTSVWADSFWESWTYVSAPLTQTTLQQPEIRVIGMAVTLIGIIYFSVVMGFIVDVIRATMDNLKKGKNKVAVEDHTLILGWTDKSISFIRQICLANASEGGGVIVVLTDIEKEKLEAVLESHLKPNDLRGTEVIIRNGTPLLLVDLLKVSAHRAKSIIIMVQMAGDADRSDTAVLRTVLCLKSLPELSGHIVAELRDIDNEPLVRLVGGQQVEILVSHDVIGRLVLLAARSSGLASVFSALLGFEGNEFYLKEWPECVGVPFRSLSERFPNAIPLGIKTTEGEMCIFPDFDTVVQVGDEILVLAEDDDTYKAYLPAEVEAGCLPELPRKIAEIERILMCGWRRDIRDMIKLLDELVAPGTELHMICEKPTETRNEALAESGLDISSLSNVKLVHHFGNTTIRRHLELIPLDSFTSVVILADQSREADIMHSDSHSLASSLLIRDLQYRLILKKHGINASVQSTCKCVSEILDPRTQRTIAESTTAMSLSEFIESNELVSRMLAMISESRDVRVILDELFGPSGSSFDVESSSRYCRPTEEVSFWQLAKRAMFRGELLCGYQTGMGTNETVLNPPDKDKPRVWAMVDLIVLRSKLRRSIVVSIPQDSDRDRASRQREMPAGIDQEQSCQGSRGSKICPLAGLCGSPAGRYLRKSSELKGEVI